MVKPQLSWSQKLTLLRNEMNKHHVDAYLIGSQDAHGSEYPPESDARRVYLTGFTGSAGTALVTSLEAFLWTDSRYFEQATGELSNSSWKLMKDGLPGVPTLREFLASSSSVETLGYDPLLLSLSQYRTFKELSEKKMKQGGLSLVPIEPNLVDIIWQQDNKPLPPCTPTFLLRDQETAFPTREKIKTLRETLSKKNVTCGVFTHLDDIAWLTNLRASDINYCPLFLSYMLLTHHECRLYIAQERLDQECQEHLSHSSILLRPYSQLFQDLTQLSTQYTGDEKIWIEPTVNMKVYTSIHNADRLALVEPSPIELIKAKKTDFELDGLRQAHVFDGVAKVAFLCWLEHLAENRDALQAHTEWTVSKKLEEYRRLMPENKGLSFETISSIGTNTAVIHYSPTPVDAKRMSHDIYLVDSGGQYLGGTTDVTRTLHLGTPTPKHKKIWTYVLKGHLQLVRQRFPKGTVGPQLDVLCRQFLWTQGLNYLHGTGHGVGVFLNVHEGPHHISTYHRGPSKEVPLDLNMVVTNEPGYYETNEFGVRIENVLVVKRSSLPVNQTTGDIFYEFEDLTLIPHQKKMMDLSLLTPEEIEQINSYHQRVWETLEPHLTNSTVLPNKEEILQWLREATSPISHVHQ